MSDLSLEYQFNKISVLKQFHVVRKLAPVLTELAPVLKDSKEGEKGEGQNVDKMLEALSPIVSIISKLPDDEAESIIFSLLEGVSRKNHGAWTPVVNGKILMFADIDLPLMMRLVVGSFKANLQNFFAVLPKASKAE